ncbi:MAG: PucR family transcriptional regulator, partial [Jiangellaceae bacterium]
SDADAVAHALSVRGRVGSVATIDEVFLDVVTVRIADLLAAEGMGDVGPLPALARHDAEHGTDLVETAQAYLAHGGDVRDAAQMLHIHPNTLRNRVRRAHAACGVDLDDADTRLAVMLQLRAADLTGGDGH